MKQSIQLRLGQHLAMTPQLQQAIRLLQLSTLDLQLEIQNTLDSNLMLEVDEGQDETPVNDDYNPREVAREEVSGTDFEGEPPDVAPMENTSTIPDDLPVDSVWDDIYDGSSTYSQGDASAREGFESTSSEGESLYEHLLWQMRMSPFSETDQAIALTIMDSINEDGYLAATMDELLQGLSSEFEVTSEEIEAVLHRIQTFDPVGVGARNLGECLLIQLRQFDPATPFLKEAERLVSDFLDLLGKRDYAQIMRQMKLTQPELNQVISLVQSLHPRPGNLITSEPPAYIIPDVIVKKHNSTWRVELNPETAPRLRINSQYAGLVRRADNSDDNNCLKNHLQEARWFIKSLQSRNETLLKVASCIVEHQRGFLELGEQAMKPLVLRDVADAVEMHESTISRITTQKYMHTPRGIYEFKFFFSSHVGTTDGGECSSTAIRALIKALVSEETPSKPLSDSKLAQVLLDKGINVARRTVAKYREALSIPPSNERKRL
ncbi:MAG: RNA polymerase factor sigma-54 [Gammaproteobacteria bacterium]